MLSPFPEPIYVTKPMLPPLSEVITGIEKIYDSGFLTNMGPLHQKLESALNSRLGGKEILLFNNGTIALMAALNAMNLAPGSEVITTPFSFAATTHAISAMGLKPVFADIEPTYMTLDPVEVRKKITPQTSCILAVHVYGFPCDVHALEAIGREFGIGVIYDAAHAFGATLDGAPLANFGDASIFSFHATKLFNSIEGGCVVSNKADVGRLVHNYRNFGIINEDLVESVGINGKMSEIHSLFGLLNLQHYEEEVAKRKALRDIYVEELRSSSFIHIIDYPANIGGSYQYFPIRVHGARDEIYKELKDFNVFTRRYFYPLISNFECYKDLPSAKDLPHAQTAAQQVLCLPFYGDLEHKTARDIASFVSESAAKHNS